MILLTFGDIFATIQHGKVSQITICTLTPRVLDRVLKGTPTQRKFAGIRDSVSLLPCLRMIQRVQPESESEESTCVAFFLHSIAV